LVLQVNRFDVAEAATATAGVKADATGDDVIAALRDRVPDLRKPFPPRERIRPIDSARSATPSKGALDRVTV
jgi:hypothetical protein